MTIQNLYSIFTKSSGVSIDTRTISPGCLFFALRGPNFDANQYAAQAIAKGASHAIIDNKKYKKSDKYIVVKDALTTLQELSKYHRSRLKIPVLGITGSNGKTTTKELVSSVLSQQYKVLATRGNLNNHIGVPLTLLSILPSHEIAIIEMGTNNFGEIAFLAQLANPTHGLLTSIGKAHLEGLKDLDGVTKEKCALFDHVLMNGGIIFKNMNDKRISKYMGIRQKTKTYSISGYDQYKFELNKVFPQIEMKVRGGHKKKSYKIKSSLIGKYNGINISGAIAVGLYFGLSMDQIAIGIKTYIPTNNRTQLITWNKAQVYLDAYNANPTSMKLAIKVFAKAATKSKKIVVLGDMLEVGMDEMQEHQAIVDYLQKYDWDQIILVGERFKASMNTKHKSVIYKVPTSDLLHHYLTPKRVKGKVILVKGSRSMKLERAFQ